MMHRSKFRLEAQHLGSGSQLFRWAIYYGSSDLAPLKSSTGAFPTKAEALSVGKVAMADFLRRMAANAELDDD